MDQILFSLILQVWAESVFRPIIYEYFSTDIILFQSISYMFIKY